MVRQTASAMWVALGLAAGVTGTSVWLHAQGSETRREAVQTLRAQGGKVFTGGDIGLKVEGARGDVPVVVPVIKVNGEWVEVEFGGGGIRRLSK